MFEDVDGVAVDVADESGGDDVVRRAFGDHASAVQQADAIGEGGE
jgi:hypothetical protein